MLKIKPKHITGLKVFIHLASICPITLMFYQAFTDQLGADPIESILHFTGIGAFNLLLLSLSISPLARLFKQASLIGVRRLIGLYAFAYALSHFFSYLIFDLQLEWALLFSEIIKRPYISVGFISFVTLALLAFTSTKPIQRKMGATWQKLHNWVYLAGILTALHYLWSVKSGLAQPIIYLVMIVILLIIRRKKLTKHIRLKRKEV